MNYKMEPFRNYLLQMINEFLHVNQFEPRSDDYIPNIVLYKMNSNVPTLVQLILKNKKSFKNKKCYVIDSSYYKDVECCLPQTKNYSLPKI